MVARGYRPAVLLAIVWLGLNLRTVIASLPPLLPDIRADLGLSATLAGLLTTLPVLCFGLLAPPARRLAHRLPLEAMLVGCALVTAVAAALRGIGTVAALFVGSILAGASVAMGQTALPVLIRIAFHRAVGRMMGSYSMALPIGATLGAGLAVPLQEASADRGGPRWRCGRSRRRWPRPCGSRPRCAGGR